MEVPEIKKVNKDKINERNTNSVKGRLFKEFDELTIDGEAVEVDVSEKMPNDEKVTDKKMLQYVRALASMYNQQEANGKRVRTKTNPSKTVVFVYAENLSDTEEE